MCYCRIVLYQLREAKIRMQNISGILFCSKPNHVILRQLTNINNQSTFFVDTIQPQIESRIPVYFPQGYCSGIDNTTNKITYD